MSFSHCIFLFIIVALLAGCTTSTVVEGARNTEIQITPAGEILYREQTIPQDKIPAYLKDDNVKREETIRILIPVNQEQRDYLLMRSIADTLKRSGYGRILFTTEKKATAKLKETVSRKP